MANFFAQYPASNGTSSNASVGTNGAGAPTSSTEVGGIGADGNLHGLSVTNTGVLNVNIDSTTTNPLPVRDSAAETSLASIDTKTPALGQAAMAASSPVVIASNQSTINIQAQTGSNIIGKVGIDQTTPGTTNGVQVVAALPAGTNVIGHVINDASSAIIGKVGIDQTTPGITNGVQVNAALPAGGNTIGNVGIVAGSSIIGKVSIDQTTPGTTNGVQINAALPAGSNVIGALTANQSVNNAQVNGVTVSTGNGVSGTGVQRVAIASDNTAFTVNSQSIPQSTSTNAATSVASTALEASHVLKASSGRLLQLTGVNTKSSAQYIQVFNSTTVPADSTVPVLLCYVPANSCFSFDFGDIGRYFSTGIAVSNSSTAATKTIGSADCWFNAELA